MADFEVRQTNGGETRVINFRGKMTIQNAQEIKAALVEVFARAKQIQVDLGEVTEVDLAGMQLVCAAHRAAINLKKNFTISGNFSEGFSTVAADAGFSRHAGCTEGEVCPWVGGGN